MYIVTTKPVMESNVMVAGIMGIFPSIREAEDHITKRIKADASREFVVAKYTPTVYSENISLVKTKVA